MQMEVRETAELGEESAGCQNDFRGRFCSYNPSGSGISEYKIGMADLWCEEARVSQAGCTGQEARPNRLLGVCNLPEWVQAGRGVHAYDESTNCSENQFSPSLT